MGAGGVSRRIDLRLTYEGTVQEDATELSGAIVAAGRVCELSYVKLLGHQGCLGQAMT